MSFFQNKFLMNIDKPQIKNKNKSKKLFPTKPSYLMPSSTIKSIIEKEAQLMKKDLYYKFNNQPFYTNLNLPLKNRNIYNKDMALTNNSLNNSIKNIHILLKNNNNDNKNIINMNINMNNNLLVTNNSIKNIYNYYDENKENLKNMNNTNFNSNNSTIKNDTTILVNKANKFNKENKLKNNIYKKVNLKPKVKRRTMSSNIDMNQIISNINNENNNLKKKNVYDNTNNSFLFDLISNHKKNNSIVTNINIKEKNISLKKITLEKIKSSRSFSNSVDKKINKDKKFSKNNSINKNKYQDNNINSFNSTGNQFYTHLKKIIPSIKNYKIKINDNNNNSINKISELRNNSLNKSFTTNNFLKRFNLSQYEKPSGKENYFNKRLNTIEHDNDDNEQKIKDYFSYIKTNNNNLITNNSNSNKFRKKYKTKSISDISNLDITILNKSRDTILSKNNCSIIENEKELKKKVFKKILKIDSCTIPGYSLTGVKQKNQDSFFLKKNFLSKDEHFFIGICDGHGLFGDLVSQYISETLPLYVKDISKEELIKAFINTNNSLTNNTKIDCSLSGATCTSLIITLDKIICANIGDTRAILAKFENGCYNTVNLSRDHKPTESDEIKRILSEGGVIKQLYDKNKKEYTGPERIWLKNSDIPGLSMSRSFGDNLAHTVGVTYIPEVRIFDYTGGEKFIVIASESVWQYIDSDECVRIVKDYYEKNMDAVGALNSLVTEAIKRLKKEENKIEDITAVVIFFE